MTNETQREPASRPDTVRVFIEDHTGDRRREARIAATAPIHRIRQALVSVLGLPSTDPNGRAVGYILTFGERQLQDEETLAGVGVRNGSQLTLFPELLAGGGA